MDGGCPVSDAPFDPAQPAPEQYSSVALVPDAVWMHIRDAVVAGVPVSVVSNRSGVPEQWITVRAEAQKWLTPERRERIIQQYGLTSPGTVEKVMDELELAAAAVSADQALKYRAKVAKKAGQLLVDALENGVLEPPTKWKDAQIADNMTRKAFGLEDGPEVQQIIQLGALTQEPQEVIDIAAEVFQQNATTSYEH